jgi:hypothetical protein
MILFLFKINLSVCHAVCLSVIMLVCMASMFFTYSMLLVAEVMEPTQLF